MLGAEGVGKTLFIQRVLDLKTAPPIAMSARKVTVNETSYMVRLVEILFDEVKIAENDSISWPDTINDLAMPRIDGAYVLYDVTNKDSLDKIPEMLSKYSAR